MKSARIAIPLLILVAVVGSVAAALAFGNGKGPPHAGEMQKFTPLDAPRPAPDVTFSDADGRSTSLAAFRGKIVLVNLWATWCAPCVEEMPALDRLQAALGGDTFAVVAISSDRAGAKAVDPFVEKVGLKALKPYLDPPGAATRAFAARGLPTSILLDRDGNELGRLEGKAAWDSADAKALIRHYIDAKPSPGPAPTNAAAATAGTAKAGS
jgi:thiol-disulfide isomerase/thioredoxin